MNSSNSFPRQSESIPKVGVTNTLKKNQFILGVVRGVKGILICQFFGCGRIARRIEKTWMSQYSNFKVVAKEWEKRIICSASYLSFRI